MKTSDLELLEEYLDGALDAAAVVELRDRLGRDAELSAALAELQSQRAIRQAVYLAMEPTELAAQQLSWRVRGAMLDQQQNSAVSSRSQWSQWRMARIGSAAAACLVLGFFFGRLGHRAAPAVSPSANPAGIASSDSHGTLAADNHPGQFVPVAAAPRISVPITNEYGQVVAWQTFDNSEQAKNFTEDLHKAHGDSAPPVNSAQPKLVDSPQVPF
jgi:anti-sigma factor RsiW